MKREDYIIKGYSLENIRNRYEVIVIRLMKKFIPEFPRFDGCKTCIEDVYALSLSRIPSTYVIDQNIKFSEDEAVDESVEEIVKYALYQVSSHPKHEKKIYE